MNFCTLINRKKEMVPAINGDTTQLATIDPTLPQLTISGDIPTAATWEINQDCSQRPKADGGDPKQNY